MNVAVLPFTAATSSEFVETVRVAASGNWVTVIICEVISLPETVTVAVRIAVVGLACAVTVTKLLFVPLAGFTVNQL